MDISLCKAVLSASLLPTEKLVGMVIAFHVHRKGKFSRIRQETLAKECGVSIPTIKRAVAALRKEQLIQIKTTGRASYYQPLLKESTYVEVSPVIPQTARRRAIGNCNPWELDTVFSTKAEEQYKRLLDEEKGNGKRESTTDAD